MLDFIKALPPVFLACRDYGHTWAPHTVQWLREVSTYHRTLVCSRCGTVRSQYLSSTGGRLPGGAYTYPEGYQALGTGGVDRDLLRVVSLSNALGAAG